MLDQNDPYASDSPTYDPTQQAQPAASKDPWTPDELAQSQQWANQYYTSHQIPTSYGTPDDLANNYLTQRRNGVGHQAAMDAVPGLLGWDKYQAPAAKQGGDVAAPDYGSDSGILAQIAQWAGMPGADPSLKNNPNYWLDAIKSRGGLNAGNLQYWQDASVGPTAFFNNPNRESSGGPAPAPTGGGNTSAPIAPPNISIGSGSSATSGQGDALYAYLMQKAQQSSQVDPNDPLIRSQSDNYSANLTRTGRQYLSELAERKGAGGNIGAESRMIAEKNAQAGASHEGDLIQHESDMRRQEIEQALALGAQYMTAQQQRDLQAELAKIDANTRIYQTQVQDRQFGQGQAQNQGQFDSNMTQREREFNDNLRQRAYEFDTTDEFNRSPYAQRTA